MVTKNQLIISCIFNGGNFFMLIYFIYDVYMRPNELEHITRWSYYMNSIFTTICLFCDIINYLSQQDKEQSEHENSYSLMIDEKSKEIENIYEKLNDWNRNQFGVICNSLGYFVSIGFWSLFFLGNSLMQVSQSIKNVFNCIYNHIIIQIVIIVDVFVSTRKCHKFSWQYFGIIYSIFTLYCIIIYIEKFTFMRNAYYFMENSSRLFLLLCFVIASLLLYISYLIHIFLIKLKYRKLNNENSSFDDNEEKREQFIEEGRF